MINDNLVGREYKDNCEVETAVIRWLTKQTGAYTNREHKSPLKIRKMSLLLWGLCEKLVIQLDNQSRKERTQSV